MIGGYVGRESEVWIERLIASNRAKNIVTVSLSQHGVQGSLFYTGTGDERKDWNNTFHLSPELAVVSDDFLAVGDSERGYERINVSEDFPRLYQELGAGAYRKIVSDYRMALVDFRALPRAVYLVSNRAGSGRMYYERTEDGIAFCSDIRVLLGMGRHEVSDVALYAILKYGAVPEPMTICTTISAVPVGHYARLDLDEYTVRTEPYFTFRFSFGDTNNPRECDVSMLAASKTVLKRSAQLLQTLDASILMSGGIDSTLFANYMEPAGEPRIRGFTCSFGEGDHEVALARQAAEKSGIELHVVTLRDSDVIHATEQAALLSGHPHDDYSVVPTVFTLGNMPQPKERSRLVVECNGGDDCFGFQTLARRAYWGFIFWLPGVIKEFAARRLMQEGNMERCGQLQFVMKSLAKATEPQLDLCPLVKTPIYPPIVEARESWTEEVSTALLKTFRECAEDWSGIGFYGRATVAQILHICSRLWAAKALVPGDGLGWKVVYPYLWVDVLVEQGKLPWTCKVYRGEVKWALKKLLEEFMPHDFIYRRKSGFTPPLSRWMAQKEFNGYLRDSLISERAVVTRVASRRVLERLLNTALLGRAMSPEALFLLWSAAFTELWIAKHWRK